MLLNDRTIALIAAESALITPYDPACLGPASYDVHLGNSFMRFRDFRGAIDPDEPPDPDRERAETLRDDDVFVLYPSEFALATTRETISLPAHLAAQLAGRSSFGRLGLQVHCTAGFVDPGFSGELTLELKNLNSRPILLRPGMRIAQLTFTYLIAEAVTPYGSRSSSKYKHQAGATPSRGYQDVAPPIAQSGSLVPQ